MMKFKKRAAAVMASLSVLMPAVCTNAYAAGTNITELEKKISDEKKNLEKTEEEIERLDADIQKKTNELTDINIRLDKMEEERLEKYEDIKLRIKYLYENGDTTMMEVLITQDGYSNVLNRAELTKEIHKYDREKLEEYANLIDDIKAEQEKFEAGIEDLEDMKKEQKTLQTQLEKQIADDEDELKKRKEEERKKKEEALRKAKSSKPMPTGTVQRTGNKYSYCDSDLYLIYAIVMQECGASYDGALAVITCACNRAESSKWGYIGRDPLTQLTAKSQFCYSLDSHWKKYLNNNVPQHVRDAVADALNGKRNHQYLSFRGYVVSGGLNIGGNYYFSAMV